MKKATLALLTVTAAASTVGIANAVPFGSNDIPSGLANHGGSPPGLTNEGGSPPGLSNQGGSPLGLSGQGFSSSGNNPLIPVNTPVTSVPEGGTSLLLLGTGLLALVLWRRRLAFTTHD